MNNWQEHPITASEVMVDTWLRRLESARESSAYKSWKDMGDVCHAFYKNKQRFMWDDKFLKKNIGPRMVGKKPMFEITVNKAWEYVEVFGPYLFWEYPHRQVKAHEPLPFGPELFGDPNDPRVQEVFAAEQHRQQMEYGLRKSRCEAIERYLNYSQREQPGGLKRHSDNAIKDALIRGRGVLVPRSYSFEGSDRTLTKLEWVNVMDLFIDPDCSDPELETAKWVAIRHQSTVEDVEDHFNLKRGTLEGAGNLSSYDSVAMNNRSIKRMHQADGKTNDLIIWYEIWSKCGVGDRKKQGADIHNAGMDGNLVDALDEVVGDYAYLCIAPSVPWLLNAPPKILENVDDDEIEEMLGWPLPTYLDSRWPLALLDFNPDAEGAWPLPPLSAAMGEMICMNVLTSAFVEKAYEDRKGLVVIAGEALKDFEAKVQGNDNPAVVRLNADVQKAVKDLVSFIERPRMNTDIIDALNYVAMLFEKRTGLVEFMYGYQQKVSRSARDIASKEEKTALRPEKMAQDVAAWQTTAATLEMFLTVFEVDGRSVHPMVDARLWDALVTSSDPELVLREMKCIVEATDIRRPNRERDIQNFQTLSQTFGQAAIEQAQITGNGQSLQGMWEMITGAMEHSPGRVDFSDWAPQPPPPEVQQQMQMEQQAEQAKSQAEIQSKMLDLEIKKVESQMKVADMRQGLLFDQESHDQEIEQSDESHTQELLQGRLEFLQGMQQRAAEGRQKLELAENQGQQKIRMMRAQAASKPQPNGSAK